MPANFRERNIALAESYWEQGDPSKAIQVLQEMLANDSHDSEALLLLSFILYRQGEYKQAENLCTPLIFEPEYSSRAKLTLGRIAFAKGEKSKAFRWFSECLQEYPNNLITMAWYARASQWDSLAQEAAREAEKSAKKNPQVLSIVFFTYHEQEKGTAAERRVLNEMSENISDSNRIYFQLYIMEKEENRSAAYQLLKQYKKQYPEDSTYDSLYESYGKQLAQENIIQRSKESNTDKWRIMRWCIILIMIVLRAGSCDSTASNKYTPAVTMPQLPKLLTTPTVYGFRYNPKEDYWINENIHPLPTYSIGDFYEDYSKK